MDKKSSLLWLSGPPGIGKSVLARHIVEEVIGGNDSLVFPCGYLGASFFCTYNEPASNTEEVVLGSILHQLLQTYPQCQSTVTHYLRLPSSKPLYSLDRGKLWAAIQAVLTLDSMRYCFICVDAVEELRTNAANDLLVAIKELVERFKIDNRHHRLRVLILSRYNRDFNGILESEYVIRIRPSHLQPYIAKYIRESISDFAEENRVFADIADSDLREEIAEQIVKKADGMFLWASIAWEDFKRGLLWNREVVRQKLRQLNSTSRGLNTLYDSIVSQVDPTIRQDMWSIFSVLAITARPLGEGELGTILAIERSKKCIRTSQDIDPFESLDGIIESNFPNLVRIHEDGSIMFAHLSFKEYLFQYLSEKNPEWSEKAHNCLARSCLTYLGIQDLVRGVNSEYSTMKGMLHFLKSITDPVAGGWYSVFKRLILDLLVEYPFLEYTVDFFTYHLGFVHESDPLWLQFADLAGRQSIFASGRLHGRYSGKYEVYESPLLAVVQHFQSAALVRRFADHGYDLDEKWRTVPFSRAFEYCCSRGDDHTMKDLALLLLELGADPNGPRSLLFSTSSYPRTPLQASIKLGIWELYNKLAHHPQIDLDLRDRTGQAAVHYVVQYGDERVLSDFLRLAGFDINAEDFRGDTPLHLATAYHQGKRAKPLLNADGIRLDVADKQGRTPLTFATYWGFTATALVLIAHSKALPAPEGGEMSGLICAAKHDDQSLTQILLEKYEYKDLDRHLDLSGKTVLHHATINDWPGIIELILSHASGKGIVNRIDHSGSSALHYAAALGNTASAQILLEYGASLRLQDRNGRAPTHAAADAGFKDTLMLLLQGDDIDANQRDHQERNLAHWAASIDCMDVMELIISRWPDVELARKDNLLLLPIDIAKTCKCAKVGRFLGTEMKRRGLGAMLVDIYNWDTMYNAPLLEFVEDEDQAAKYAEYRRQLELVDQRRKWKEWEDLHRLFPEDKWALVKVEEPKPWPESPYSEDSEDFEERPDRPYYPVFK